MSRNNSVIGRNPFGPQESQCDLSENKNAKGQPVFLECGCCGCYHPLRWHGDCRDDNNRFGAIELDDKYGEDGWEEIPYE